VTVLSSDDPVRVFQRYATLDALSSGRAEVILGRGSSIESFPLFGFDLADYDRLFEEKLELFARLRTERPVTWSGTTRAAMPGLAGLPAHRRRGVADLGGASAANPARFARLSELFREATAPIRLRCPAIGVHSPGHVAATDEQAREEYWPTYEDLPARCRKQRGFQRSPARLRTRARVRLPVRRVRPRPSPDASSRP